MNALKNLTEQQRNFIANFDYEKLGRAIMGSVLGSAMAGHTTVAATAERYFKGSMEAEFIADIFKLKRTDAICDKWFGSRYNASVIAAHSMPSLATKKPSSK